MSIINFYINVPQNTPENEIIYMTGNSDVLGNWSVPGIPLEPEGENRWHLCLEFLEDMSLEFKFNRGSWASAEGGDDFQPVPNRFLDIRGDENIYLDIKNWEDLCKVDNLTGNFRFHRSFYSQAMSENRTIMVYLPPNYSYEEEAYPVLYAHDGQNIFDSSTSFGGVEWRMDEAAEKLINEGKIRKIIIVGIYNDTDRGAEYTHSVDPGEGGGKVEDYASFIINELKPFIDRHYRTLPFRNDTAIIGSSLGGICSLYLSWKYSHIFSIAGVISPSLWWNDRDIIKAIQSEENFQGPDKIWLDIGTRESQDDKDRDQIPDCIEDTRWLRDVLIEKGYVPGENLFYMEDQGADHSEWAWSNRIENILLFLFGI